MQRATGFSGEEKRREEKRREEKRREQFRFTERLEFQREKESRFANRRSTFTWLGWPVAGTAMTAIRSTY